MGESLGSEIRRLRGEAGYTLRGFAEAVGISAAHQSDIEHGRRLPSPKVLSEMAKLLRRVGATYEQLRALDARLDPDVQLWTQAHPEIGQMLRQVKDSGRAPKDVLRDLQRLLEKDDGGTGQ